MLKKDAKRINQVLLALLIIYGSLSCTFDSKLNNNSVNQAGPLKLQQSSARYFFDLAKNNPNKKGATVRVVLNKLKYFDVKASSNGSRETTATDVKSYQVYLVKSAASTFPLNGDPLNLANIIAGPFSVNTYADSSTTINFTNVGGSTVAFGSGDYYYAAVRAYSGLNATGIELIKPNNGSATVWSGTTASSSRVAVSTGAGVQIRNNDLSLSFTTALPVSPALLDAYPNKVDASITLSGANAGSIESYVINLCTDPTRPISTKVLATPYILNRNYLQMSSFDTVNLANLPNGTYYATVEGYSNINGTGLKLIKTDNNGAVYNGGTAPDANAQVAVSTNSVNINNQVLTFSPATTNSLQLNLNLISGLITTIAGNGTPGFSPDGTLATNASLDSPDQTIIDNTGNIYYTETNNHRVRKIDFSTGIITTIAGNGAIAYNGDNIQATAASLYYPEGIAFDNNGNLFIADQYHHRIRKVVLSTGVITTVAGEGTGTFAGDNGPGTGASLQFPVGIEFDPTGNLYIADYYNHRIRKLDTSGTITTFAGNGMPIYAGDGGQATNASLNYPIDITRDRAGNFYIGDSYNYLVRKVNPSGIISRVAGGPGARTYNGDNIQAILAGLNIPFGLAVDNYGNYYVADSEANRVREITVATGIITTIAGNGVAAYGGDGGQATSASFTTPTGLGFDIHGNMYITHRGDPRIRKVIP